MFARLKEWRHGFKGASLDCSAPLALAFAMLLGLCGLCGLLAAPAAAQTPAASKAQAKPASLKREPVLLVVGDSLSAEYGISRGQGWVALLDARLKTERVALRVVNASISGDTTSGGRSRLPALLAQHRPSVVVVELGGNDALRGLPLSMTRDNLSQMARSARASGAQVLLLGMQLPPNYGRRYSSDFATLFADVAQKESAALVPFLLAGIADGADAERWFQADRIHPTAQAHPRMLDNVWPLLRPLLKAAAR